MSIENDIKSILVKEGFNVASFSEQILKTSRQNFSRKLKQETISYKEIIHIANLLNYEIKWIKKNDRE